MLGLPPTVSLLSRDGADRVDGGVHPSSAARRPTYATRSGKLAGGRRAKARSMRQFREESALSISGISATEWSFHHCRR